MNITLLKGKIHRATVKQAALDYVGSITIDEALMEASGIVEYENIFDVRLRNFRHGLFIRGIGRLSAGCHG